MNAGDRSPKRPSSPSLLTPAPPSSTPLQDALHEFIRAFEFARETLDVREYDTFLHVLTAWVARLTPTGS